MPRRQDPSAGGLGRAARAPGYQLRIATTGGGNRIRGSVLRGRWHSNYIYALISDRNEVSASAVSTVLLPPFAKSPQDGPKALSLVGEVVLEPGRVFAVAARACARRFWIEGLDGISESHAPQAHITGEFETFNRHPGRGLRRRALNNAQS